MSQKRKPGYGLLALLVVFTLGSLVVPPINNWDNLRHDVRTGTILDVGSDPDRMSRSRGDVATFELPDGTNGSVYLGRRLDQPDPGDSIDVYHEGDRWIYARPYGWTTVVWQVLLVALGLAMITGWVFARRKLDPANRPQDDPFLRRP
ncbi:hypothetical protein [Nocardioides insulae]|uniref:hypothetical protein n=1 Tax=Nocardioides insulae TaxID=394734 RepID=UPI00040D6269|nr:hypothetical protein [Nocardioides insulae]